MRIQQQQYSPRPSNLIAPGWMFNCHSCKQSKWKVIKLDSSSLCSEQYTHLMKTSTVELQNCVDITSKLKTWRSTCVWQKICCYVLIWPSLCLSGRSHKAYGSRVVVLSVSQSVCLSQRFLIARWKLSTETSNTGRNWCLLEVEFEEFRL